VLRAPAAFLTLVDAERDFYAAAVGLPEPIAATRELTGPTFCELAIAGADPLVIPDTAADPAYRDVPTVRSLGVAAYVGVPLVVDGQPVGSLCAIDTAPRAWAAHEVEVLRALADSALREIELRRANAALRAGEQRLRDVFEQAPVAVAVLRGRVAADLVFELVNPRYTQMLPPDRAPLGRRLGDALPELAGAMGPVLQRVLDTGEPFVAAEYRCRSTATATARPRSTSSTSCTTRCSRRAARSRGSSASAPRSPNRCGRASAPRGSRGSSARCRRTRRWRCSSWTSGSGAPT
jgi:PAS domain-containing protein